MEPIKHPLTIREGRAFLGDAELVPGQEVAFWLGEIPLFGAIAHRHPGKPAGQSLCFRSAGGIYFALHAFHRETRFTRVEPEGKESERCPRCGAPLGFLLEGRLCSLDEDCYQLLRDRLVGPRQFWLLARAQVDALFAERESSQGSAFDAPTSEDANR